MQVQWVCLRAENSTIYKWSTTTHIKLNALPDFLQIYELILSVTEDASCNCLTAGDGFGSKGQFHSRPKTKLPLHCLYGIGLVKVPAEYNIHTALVAWPSKGSPKRQVIWTWKRKGEEKKQPRNKLEPTPSIRQVVWPWKCSPTNQTLIHTYVQLPWKPNTFGAILFLI